MSGAMVALGLCSCSIINELGTPTEASSQGSVGSCHSFVVASMYEEKLKREGLQHDLSEKDLFLRVYFRGLDERQEILRQLTMSADRPLPWTFREGATLDRVAAQVKKHGVLSTAEDPYSRAFKAGLPMQMNQFRNARVEVHRKASAMKQRLGRPLTRAEKASIVDAQYALLQKQGVIDALRIKQGNRANVRRFAGNFTYRQVNAGRSTRKLPHIVKLLEQGSVGAGLVQYPWTSGSRRRATSGHAVVLRDYDPDTGEFVVTNPWWLGSFGFKRHDRIEAREFMRYLDTYGWLQDVRPVAMRKSGPSEVAAARIAKGKRVGSRSTASKPVSKPSGTGFFAKLFAKRTATEAATKTIVKVPDQEATKAKTTKKTTAVAKTDTSKKKGLLYKWFSKKPARATTVAKAKPASDATKTAPTKKATPATAKPKKKGLLHKLFKKSSKKKTVDTKPATPAKKKVVPAKPQQSAEPKGLLYKWFKKKKS